jgi:hypothetical protein
MCDPSFVKNHEGLQSYLRTTVNVRNVCLQLPNIILHKIFQTVNCAYFGLFY